MSVTEKLRNLGLTDYESKAYLSFVLNGEMTARELSHESGVPYSKTYEVASNLEKKGLIEVQKGRPMVFRAIPPQQALKKCAERFISELEDEFQERKNILERGHNERVSDVSESLRESLDKLQSFYDERGSVTASDDLIWTIRGRKNVIAQMRELIQNSRSLKMILHGELLQLLVKDLEMMKARGEIIFQAKDIDIVAASSNIRIFSLESVPFECGVLIADEGKTLFVAKDLETGFKSSNPGLLMILNHFFEHEKDESKVI